MIKLLMYFFGIFLIAFSYWLNQNFGIVNLNQVIFTLVSGANGLLVSDIILLKSFTLICIGLPMLITFILFFIDKITLLPLKIKLHYIVLLAGIIYLGHQVSILEFISGIGRKHSDYFKSNYVDTHQANFHTSETKSLVLIYAESIEDTYSDAKIFGHDLLRSLNQLKNQGISFSNYLQMPGSEWTMAAMVSTQCGVPLKLVTVFGGNVQGEMLMSFLPGVKCMSDILAERGYKNVYMNGSSIHSCGLGNFLKSHQFHEVYGKEDWLARRFPENDMSGWGLHDDDLLEQAIIKLAELIKSKQPFNLTISTIDTHGPYGLLSKTCKRQGFHDFTGIVECEANQLADFVNFVRKKGWLDKVNIIILGDHRAMRNPVYDKLESSQYRYLFNLFISNNRFKKYTDDVVPFDMLPTILESIGIVNEGGRLALGYSAISPDNLKKPPNRIPVMDKEIGKHSRAYNMLWTRKA